MNKALTGVLLGLSSSLAFSQGFYSNFEQLIEIQKTNYGKKLESLASGKSELNDLVDPSTAQLDPDFLSSLIFHTPSRFAALGTSDRCSLYDLILSNLAQGPMGDLESFLVRHQTKEGKVKTVLVDRNTFFEKVAFAQCPQSKTFQNYFSLENLPATLQTISLETPTSENSCKTGHQNFIKDPKTPYLCYLSHQIKSIPDLERASRTTPTSQYRKLQRIKRDLKVAQRYQSLLNPASVDYLDALCSNIESSKAFCDTFFNASFWQRALSGEKSPRYLLNVCGGMLSNERPRPDLLANKTFTNSVLAEKNLRECVRRLEEEPALCRFTGTLDQSLSPRPDCSILSSNLNASRLKADYSDCPGQVANAGIVNIVRLIAHFGETPPESSFCQASTTAAFAKFNDENEGRFWKSALCYDDKIRNEEVCLPTVFGEVAGSSLSLPTTVANILRRTKGMGADQNCRLVTQDQFRPELLEFQSGCFVIVDADECHGTSCAPKIVLNQREMDHIKIKTGAEFDYFPKDFANENFAQSKLVERTFKLHSVRIMNVSALKRVFDEHQKALAHGVACREDLFPEMFSKRAFNQCSPLPFIIDGYKSKNGIYSVVLRSAHDSLHAPRLVPWSHLFSAVKDYQRLHPLNTWGLNALY